ncbi:MAG: hypothetical protein FWE67_01015 [Planctomycetaceae bacterium]|nr:hypothetical protein [Planctomycetaceae bacterium]
MCNGITQQFLSTPTHIGGWIAPVAFMERIIADPIKLANHDLNDYILALYRIAAIADGRLDAPVFAAAVDFHLRNELPKTNRWSEKSNVISAVSPDRVAVVREMLERTLPDFPPKQLVPFIELLYELCVGCGVPVMTPQTLEFLKRLTGKPAQIAKKMLQ